MQYRIQILHRRRSFVGIRRYSHSNDFIAKGTCTFRSHINWTKEVLFHCIMSSFEPSADNQLRYPQNVRDIIYNMHAHNMA